MANIPIICMAIEPEVLGALFTPQHLEQLRSRGDLLVDPAGTGAELMARCDILITGWGSPRLPDRREPGCRARYVVHSAGSIRSVIPQSLIADGVRASQASAGMSQAVAEFALTLCLCLRRHVHTFDRTMTGTADWQIRSRAGLGESMAAARVGVVGASRTGRSFIGMVRALGAQVTVYDPYLSDEDAAALGVTRADLLQLCSTSDIVAVHAPVTDETRAMLGAREFAAMRDGTIFVNTARPAVVDQQAMLRELLSGRLRAGLDVFDREPLPHGHPLLGLPNVMVMPHQAGATRQARECQGTIVTEEVRRYLSGEVLHHEVTADRYELLA